jgi:hypothetical protein
MHSTSIWPSHCERGSGLPACGGRYRGYGGSYSPPSYYSPSGSGGSSGGGSGSSARPRWSRPGSSVVYTLAEVRALTPVRSSVENRASLPDPRDVFLCHAWDDRGRARGTFLRWSGDNGSGQSPQGHRSCLHRSVRSGQRRICCVLDRESSARSSCAADFAAEGWLPFSGPNQIRVEPALASFMADSQVPWGVDALSGAISQPAWKTKPSYYLVATEDKMIPPPAQRAMAERAKAQVTEVPGSHAVYAFPNRPKSPN